VKNRLVDGVSILSLETAFKETNEPTLEVGDLNGYYAFIDPVQKLSHGEHRR